jgi:hypothetical protein
VTLPLVVTVGVGPEAVAIAASGSMMMSAVNVPPAAVATAAAGLTVTFEPALTVGVGPLAVATAAAGLNVLDA